jgi:hypothetical protein
MNMSEVEKASSLIAKRKKLLDWQSRESLSTAVVFSEDSRSRIASLGGTQLSISIPRAEAQPYLNREIERVEQEPAKLGVDLDNAAERPADA